MQHFSGVAFAATGTAGMAEGIVSEETVEEIIYGKYGFLDGSFSTQETKNPVGLIDVSKGSRN